MSESNIVRSSLYTLLAEAGLFVAGTVTAVLTARILLPEGKGLLALLVLIPSTVVALGKLGLDTANTYQASKDPATRPGLVANSVVVAFGWGGLAALLGLMVLFLIPGLGKVRTPLALAVLLIPVSLLSNYLISILLGVGRVALYNWLRLANALLYLAAILLGVLFGLTAWKAFAGWALALTVTTIVSAALLHRTVPIRLSWDSHLFRPTLKYGMAVQVGFAAAYLNLRLDHFLVASFLGAANLGLYTVAVTMTEAVALLPIAIAAVLLPAMASQRDATADALASFVLRVALPMVMVPASLLFLLSPWLVSLLFGHSFVGAVPALRVLLVGSVAYSINVIIGRAFLARGRPLLPTYVSFVGLAITVVLDLSLIPRLGILGAAIASSVSYGASCLLTVTLFLRLSRLPIRDLFLLRPRDLAQVWRLARGLT